MKLPDYNTSKLWADLRNKMGVTEIKEVTSSNYNRIDPATLKKLETTGIEVKTLDDIISPKDGTFEYKGQKIIVYIKEQDGTYLNSNYKYHLSTCGTINQMRRANRYNTRYVQTTRADGYFEVIVKKAWNRKVEEVLKMDVCMNCLRGLYSKYRDENFKNVYSFSIDKYFEKYKNEIDSLPLNKVKTYRPDDYTSEWDKVSIKKRQEKNWTCESCGTNYKTRKAKLHTHHINGRKDDNRDENLKVLCDACHSNEPYHNHLKPSIENNAGNIQNIKPDKPPIKNEPQIDVAEDSAHAIGQRRIQNIVNPDSLLNEFEQENKKILKLVKHGEGDKLEFKETLKWDIYQKKDNLEMTEEILRTVASFMNTNGGVVIIGVSDDGEVKGLEKSIKTNDDALKYFTDKFIAHLPPHLFWACEPKIHTIKEKNIMAVYVQPSNEAVYYQPKGKDQHSEFWIRHAARKIQMDPSKQFDYINKKFK